MLDIWTMRYGAGVVKCSQEDIRTLKRKTRKLLTIYCAFTRKVTLTDYTYQEPKVEEYLSAANCTSGQKEIIEDGQYVKNV